ncbi:hypothetical protein FDECE_2953 [Fusarium decemcellulare]|nr:hypothetical protein FDECE_2953 [Fusarium decemcellulare]
MGDQPASKSPASGLRDQRSGFGGTAGKAKQVGRATEAQYGEGSGGESRQPGPVPTLAGAGAGAGVVMAKHRQSNQPVDCLSYVHPAFSAVNYGIVMDARPANEKKPAGG